jgi:hypothetical protein
MDGPMIGRWVILEAYSQERLKYVEDKMEGSHGRAWGEFEGLGFEYMP